MFQHEEDMKRIKIIPYPQGLGRTDNLYLLQWAAEIDISYKYGGKLPGYIPNSNNQLEYWGMVNEAYANENEVWIISTNESVITMTYARIRLFRAARTARANPPGGGCTGPDCDPNEYPASGYPIHPDVGAQSSKL